MTSSGSKAIIRHTDSLFIDPTVWQISNHFSQSFAEEYELIVIVNLHRFLSSYDHNDAAI
jgi:hypothetical protein